MKIPTGSAAPRIASRLLAFATSPLPTLPIKPLTASGRLRFFAWGLALMLLSGAGLAIAESPFTMFGTEDMAIALLDKIFSGPVGEVSQVVCSVALVLGAILVAYTMVAGTMSTAHDGEMLGKKWSSLWLPIRMAAGVAAVTPTPMLANYCALQYIIAWVIVGGTGYANTAWTAWVDSAYSAEGMTIGVPSSNVTALARGMLESAICMEGARVANIMDPQIGSSNPAVSGDFDSGRFYGGFSDDPKSCGGVQFQTSLGSGLRQGAQAVVNAIDRGSLDSGSDTIRAAHQKAAAALEQDLRVIARAAYAGTGGVAATGTGMPHEAARAAYAAAIAKYQQTVAAAALTVSGNAKMLDVKETQKKNGWMLAGGYYSAFLALQDSVAQSVAATPSAIAPTDLGAKELKDILAVGRAYVDFAIRDATGDALSNASVADGESSMAQEIITGYIVKPIFGSLQDGLSGMDGERHPIAVMKDLGNHLILAGESVVLLVVGAKVAGGVAAAVVAKAIGGGFAIFLWLIFLALISMGFVLAYLLPMLPFIRWLGAIVAWLLLAIEAMMAAPFWAIAHLHPDGENFAGRGGPGYVLLVDLALRPLMMIVGLVFAYTMMQPIWWLVNKVFFSMFSLSQGQSLIGVFGLLAMIAIYTGIATWLCHHLLEAMHWIPDHVIRWISGGHGDNMLGQGAHGADGRAERSVMAIGGVINNRATLGALGADGQGPKPADRLKGVAGAGGDVASTAGQMAAKGPGSGATGAAGGVATAATGTPGAMAAAAGSLPKLDGGSLARAGQRDAGGGGAGGAGGVAGAASAATAGGETSAPGAAASAPAAGAAPAAGSASAGGLPSVADRVRAVGAMSRQASAGGGAEQGGAASGSAPQMAAKPDTAKGGDWPQLSD